MKIAAVSDPHIWNHKKFGGPLVAGVNRRCSQAATALRLAAEKAKLVGAEVLVICGDLFDGVRPEPQVISEVMQALWTGPEHTVVVKGNHDSVSDQSGDNALGPLRAMVDQGVEVLDVPGKCSMAPVVVVPYRSGPASEWLEKDLDLACTGTEGKKLLVLHQGIRDKDTPEFLRGAPDAVDANLLAELMQARKIRAAFAGHWHYPRHWNYNYLEVDGLLAENMGRVDIFQVGTLCPVGLRDETTCKDDYGRMVVWDTGSETYEEFCVPGPRFVRMGLADTAKVGLITRLVADHCQVYVTVETDDQVAGSCMLDGLRKVGVVDGEVSLDTCESEAAARSAAQAVRGADTLREAISAYVAEMPLPDGVGRGEVLSRVMSYLEVRP